MASVGLTHAEVANFPWSPLGDTGGEIDKIGYMHQTYGLLLFQHFRFRFWSWKGGLGRIANRKVPGTLRGFLQGPGFFASPELRTLPGYLENNLHLV